MTTPPQGPSLGPGTAGEAKSCRLANIEAHRLTSVSVQRVSCRRATRPRVVAAMRVSRLSVLLRVRGLTSQEAFQMTQAGGTAARAIMCFCIRSPTVRPSQSAPHVGEWVRVPLANPQAALGLRMGGRPSSARRSWRGRLRRLHSAEEREGSSMEGGGPPKRVMRAREPTAAFRGRTATV